jgi:hypothetical protein
MDKFLIHRQSEKLTVSTRPSYPIAFIPTCGDAWCVNGPPPKNISTFFLCADCFAAAPDAIALGYAIKPKGMTPKDHQKINASVLCSFVTGRNAL